MSGPVFPWRSDNRFALLNDGVRFFPRMLLAIEAAQRSIELELYLVEDGHCAELFLVALLDARRRGVAVRCLFDGFGCLGLAAPGSSACARPAANCGCTTRCAGS